MSVESIYGIFFGNRYVFLKDLKDLMISDLKLENIESPTHLLKEVIIDLETSICFVINLIFFYDIIRLLC
jgi:hypothetical protein